MTDMVPTGAATARRMWALIEPVHVVTYFAPEARQAFEAAGLRGFWRGYFAGRSAPLGPVDAPVIIATFSSFAPAFVRRALPAVWDLVTPAGALQAREAGAVAAIRAVLRDSPAPALELAADLLTEAARDLDLAGRPLGAPNAALPVPDEPVARLWRAATVLREHRGDGHIAALVAAGVDGCESLVLRTAVDQASEARRAAAVGRAQFQAVRGWTDADWDAAAGRLRDRGWLDDDLATAAGLAAAPDGPAATPDGLAATPDGLAAHRDIEAATDLAAARPWDRLGPDRTAELATALRPVARACARLLPFPNPVGLPASAASGPA